MPMTPAEARALFPAAARQPWLNAAASSPLCTPVAQAMHAHLDETLAQGDLGFPRWLAFKESVRARLARFVGATPREVAFTPSTSFGFNVVALMLKARGVTEVLSLDGEFPSTTVPFLAQGLTVRAVRRRPDGSYPLEDLAAALRPTTGAVAVSLVQFSSGFRVDVAGLAKLCRARGLALCLNGAQALGQVPVDVHALDADFLSATSHKWLAAGYGTGLLVVRERWLDATPLPLAGWLSVPGDAMWATLPDRAREEDPAGLTSHGVRLRPDASALELGAMAMTGLHGLDAALALHEAVGVETTQAHIAGLQRELRTGLRARGFTPNAPDDAHVGSGICVVPVEGSAEDAVRALLREHHVVTTPRGGGVRISTHLFNTSSDVHALLSAFDALKLRPA